MSKILVKKLRKQKKMIESGIINGVKYLISFKKFRAFFWRLYSYSMLFQCPGCDREKGERRKKSELFERRVSQTLVGQRVTILPSDWSVLATHLDW